MTALQGLRVKYSVQAGQYSSGIVLDQISRTEKQGSDTIISAYSILDDTSHQIVHPAYWRIFGCIDNNDQLCSLAVALKLKYDRDQRVETKEIGRFPY